MKTIIINNNLLQTPKDIYVYLYEKLNDGVVLGKNCDSLWDFLSTDVERPFKVKWINTFEFKRSYQKDFELIKSTFQRVMDFDKEMNLKARFEFEMEDENYQIIKA